MPLRAAWILSSRPLLRRAATQSVRIKPARGLRQKLLTRIASYTEWEMRLAVNVG